MPDFKGICVPICTPFDASGDAVDEGKLRSHTDAMLEAGIHAILSCGGTGEFAYLREDERRNVTRIVIEQVRGRAPVIAQTSAISTRETIENSKAAQGMGAAGIMVLPPYFEGPTMDGVRYHYEQIARAVDLPIIVYNIPQHSNIDITPEIFRQLLQIDNIQYIKDSTASLIRIQELVATGGKVFNGGDPIAFQGMLAGSVGCIWGAANAMPREAVELYEHVSAGRLKEGLALWRRMVATQLFFWNHAYNPSIKAAAAVLGRDLGLCRKPQLPLTDAEAKRLRQALAGLHPELERAAAE